VDKYKLVKVCMSATDELCFKYCECRCLRYAFVYMSSCRHCLFVQCAVGGGGCGWAGGADVAVLVTEQFGPSLTAVASLGWSDKDECLGGGGQILRSHFVWGEARELSCGAQWTGVVK
jgi:hypothetical protein